MIKNCWKPLNLRSIMLLLKVVCMSMVVMIENATWEADPKLQAHVISQAINCKQVPKEIWLKWGWFKFARRIQFKLFCLLFKALLHILQPLLPYHSVSVCINSPLQPEWRHSVSQTELVSAAPRHFFPIPHLKCPVLSYWPSWCIQILTTLPDQGQLSSAIFSDHFSPQLSLSFLN